MKRYSILAAASFLFVDPILAQPLQQTLKEKQALETLPRVTVTVIDARLTPGGLLLGEWSGGFLIQTDDAQILFDNGGTHLLLEEGHDFNVNLSKTKAIVISHEHGNHRYGLERIISACGRADLFVHPAAFSTRYWKLGSGAAAPHKLPFSRDELMQRVRNLVETDRPTRIAFGLWVTGQIPRVFSFEDTVVRDAFLDEKLTRPDLILDDQAVFFRVPKGIVIILGCGHAGLVNTVAYVSELTGDKHIYAIIGGTHSIYENPDRFKKTAEALRRYSVQKIMLTLRPNDYLFAEYATTLGYTPLGRVSWPGNGQVITFGGQ
jgi:7,8-dihydropterin-6-yl-methyl-4-(beta-D-ribofuranosyl)aminobenzene 5'-phosphate synthase